MSRPLAREAYRNVLSLSRGKGEWMVATRDFSGLLSSAWAFASAAAIAPMVSLLRCMGDLQIEEIETDGSGLGALGPDPVPGRLPGVLRHQALQLGLGLLVFQEGLPG